MSVDICYLTYVIGCHWMQQLKIDVLWPVLFKKKSSLNQLVTSSVLNFLELSVLVDAQFHVDIDNIIFWNIILRSFYYVSFVLFLILIL